MVSLGGLDPCESKKHIYIYIFCAAGLRHLEESNAMRYSNIAIVEKPMPSLLWCHVVPR